MNPSALSIDAPYQLNADQINRFLTEGWLLLPGLLSPTRIDGMRRVFEQASGRLLETLRADGLITDTAPDLPLERRFMVAGEHAARFGASWRKQIASRELFELHQDPALVGVIEHLLQDGVMGHAVWNGRPKLPNQQSTVVPWHQDSGYFGPATANHDIITAWIPLVPTDATNGGMQVAPRSHLHGLDTHHQSALDGGFLVIDGSDHVPDTIDITMQPGDVLLFGNLLWHRSLPNMSSSIRWSVDIRFYPQSLSGQDVGNWGMPTPWVIRSTTTPSTPYEHWYRWTQEPAF